MNDKEIVERLFDRMLELSKVKPTDPFKHAYDCVVTELTKIAGKEPIQPKLLYDLELPF